MYKSLPDDVEREERDRIASRKSDLDKENSTRLQSDSDNSNEPHPFNCWYMRKLTKLDQAYDDNLVSPVLNVSRLTALIKSTRIYRAFMILLSLLDNNVIDMLNIVIMICSTIALYVISYLEGELDDNSFYIALCCIFSVNFTLSFLNLAYLSNIESIRAILIDDVLMPLEELSRISIIESVNKVRTLQNLFTVCSMGANATLLFFSFIQPDEFLFRETACSATLCYTILMLFYVRRVMTVSNLCRIVEDSPRLTQNVKSKVLQLLLNKGLE